MKTILDEAKVKSVRELIRHAASMEEVADSFDANTPEDRIERINALQHRNELAAMIDEELASFTTLEHRRLKYMLIR